MASVASDIAGIESAKKDAATVRPDGERLQDPIEGVSVRRALTHADEQELRWKPAARLPVEGREEHVAQERLLVRAQVTDLHGVRD